MLSEDGERNAQTKPWKATVCRVEKSIARLVDRNVSMINRLIGGVAHCNSPNGPATRPLATACVHASRDPESLPMSRLKRYSSSMSHTGHGSNGTLRCRA